MKLLTNTLKEGLNICNSAEYHSDKNWVSSSSYKLILENPLKFYEEYFLGKKEEQKSGEHFSDGTYLHSLVLEPHTIASEYAFFDGLRKHGQAYEQFKTENPGKIILSKPQRARGAQLLRQFNANPLAVELIKGGEAEHTICQNWNGVPTKVRCDYINLEKGYIVDLKSSGWPVDFENAKLSVKQWKYDLSAALYAAVAAQYYKKDFEFYWIFVSKKEADCQVYKLSEFSRAQGLSQCIKAAKLYKDCMQTGVWPDATGNIAPKFTTQDEVLEI